MTIGLDQEDLRFFEEVGVFKSTSKACDGASNLYVSAVSLLSKGLQKS